MGEAGVLAQRYLMGHAEVLHVSHNHGCWEKNKLRLKLWPVEMHRTEHWIILLILGLKIKSTISYMQQNIVKLPDFPI